MSFLEYFQKIFLYYPNPKLYLKGGSVISLKLLQDINYLSEIKDFDFVLEDERCCNDYFYYEFGKEFGIFLNGCRKSSQGKNTQLHVMRNRNSPKYELSVCIKDQLELPMTSMKIFFTEDNYISLFTLLEDGNYDILKELEIIIPNHNENGMFAIEFQSNDTIISNIIINTTEDSYNQQFLYYLFKNPTNIARLKYKNIPKSNNIKKLYQVIPTWLLNEDLMLNLVEELIINITLYVNDIYKYYENDINILTEQIINHDDLLNIKNSEDVIIDTNHYILKNKIKIDRDLLRTNLTNIYIEMFQKMDCLFENININRWKDSFDLSDPLLDIFQFSHKLKLQLYNTPIIINRKILSKSISWFIVNKIKTLQ
jgi:hypothetical protein